MGNPADSAFREMGAKTYIRIGKGGRGGWVVRRITMTGRGEHQTRSLLYDTFDEALASIGGHR